MAKATMNFQRTIRLILGMRLGLKAVDPHALMEEKRDSHFYFLTSPRKENSYGIAAIDFDKDLTQTHQFKQSQIYFT